MNCDENSLIPMLNHLYYLARVFYLDNYKKPYGLIKLIRIVAVFNIQLYATST